VYGIHERCDCKENDDLHINILREGRSAYTLAKLYCEFLCLSYFNQFNTDVCVFRFFNTIGKNQHYRFGMVVPTFINQAIQGLPLTVYGNGQQTRSFCDVRDLIKGIYMASLSKKVSGNIYNLGNNQPITILQLAQYIKDILNSNSEIVFADPPRQRDSTIDVRHRKPDLSAVMRDINWKPEISWQQSVNELTHYFKMQEQVA
jgi:UDP-glucose 4-epimerase